jgi:hypothetical protein
VLVSSIIWGRYAHLKSLYHRFCLNEQKT